MVIVGWVMKLAPYAVFILIATMTVRFGTELLGRLLVYSLVVVPAMTAGIGYGQYRQADRQFVLEARTTWSLQEAEQRLN